MSAIKITTDAVQPDEEATQQSVPQAQAQPVAEADPVAAMIAALEKDAVLDGDLMEYHIKIKFNGATEEYTLRELDGEGRGVYVDFQASKAKYDAQGKVIGVRDVKGFETRIVAMSLFKDGKQVPEAVVGKFRGSLIKNLALMALRISGLDEKAKEAAKNG